MDMTVTRNPAYDGFEDKEFVTSDQVTLHYMVKGKGKPLIFIHGWSGDSRNFMFNAPVLARDFRVYVLDLRGHGYSEAPSHGARIARLSKDLQEFIDALFTEKVCIIAYSMGCTVVWSYIDLFGQELVDKLVFVDEAPFLLGNPADSEDEIRLYGGNKMDLWKLRNAVYEGVDYSGVFAESFQRPGKNKNNAEMEAIAEKVVNPPFHHEFLGELLRDHINQDWRDVFSRITVPVLLISGEIGFATTHECCEWMSREIKNCTWIPFMEEDYGTHSLMQNSPEKFNRIVLVFIN